jgi:hypothetical protein
MLLNLFYLFAGLVAPPYHFYGSKISHSSILPISLLYIDIFITEKQVKAVLGVPRGLAGDKNFS